MTYIARTMLAAGLLFAAGATAPGAAGADGIAVVRPGADVEATWTGERMLGACERLKDVLPGRRP